MAGVRFTDLQSRPTEFLDVTSVTLDEFQQRVPRPDGGMADGWATADRSAVSRVPKLSTAKP